MLTVCVCDLISANFYYFTLWESEFFFFLQISHRTEQNNYYHKKGHIIDQKLGQKKWCDKKQCIFLVKK